MVERRGGGGSETGPRGALVAAIKSTRRCNQCIIPLLQNYTVHFVCFLALYRECKTPGASVARGYCTYVRACGRTNTPIRDGRAENQHQQRRARPDASFHPSVSIHLLSVACLPPCMITRAVVKVLSTGRAVRASFVRGRVNYLHGE